MSKAKARDLGRATYEALAEFRYQIRRFLHFSEIVAREVGLEPQQHQLMLAVKAAPQRQEVRVAYLAERMQIQHHSAVELLDRLEAKGMIQRERGRLDRREVHVRLTPQGERVLGELTVQMRAELRSAAPKLVAALKHVMTQAASPKMGERAAEFRDQSLEGASL
jgi:DNA-binding MarR family transcriptional regulator